MATRGADDPWFTLLYRDPRRLWWAPALFIGCFVMLMDLFVFDRSVRHSVAVGSLMAVAAGVGSFSRWRRSNRP